MPLLVIGIADGGNLLDWSDKEPSHPEAANGDQISASHLHALSRNLDDLKEGYPLALVHRILVFDDDANPAVGPGGITPVPPLAKSRTTTMKTIMCDLTSLLLAEMAEYAKSIHGLPSVATPRADVGSVSNDIASALPSHMGGASRPNSAAERSRSFSPAGDARLGHRMSMPTHVPSMAGYRASSPDRQAGSPASGMSTPPTTFEEVNGNDATTSSERAQSRDRVRPGSQDRISTTGLASGNIAERERNRGKARIGVVIGALYLLAGRWPDAIKELTQSATISRANNDYVWQAKAMDYLVVCLLVCSWAGMYFRVSLLVDGTIKLMLFAYNTLVLMYLRYPTSSVPAQNVLVQAPQNLQSIRPATVNMILRFLNPLIQKNESVHFSLLQACCQTS